MAEIPDNQLTSDDRSQLKRLTEFYVQIKLLILYSEEIDPDARSNIQVIKELRDALDHIMRVMNVRLANGQASEGGSDLYCAKNLDRAYGHLSRAAFDALDGTILSLKERIAEILETYPLEVIREVVPDYWDKRKFLESLTHNIASDRASKDVGSNIPETFDRYVADVEAIKNFYSDLVQAGPSLDACNSKHKKTKTEENSDSFWTQVKAGILYSIIVGILTGLFSIYAINQSNNKETISNSDAQSSTK